jgi:hypothetical protein
MDMSTLTIITTITITITIAAAATHMCPRRRRCLAR